MMLYKPGSCAFRVMTRVVANADPTKLAATISRDVNLIVAVSVKQTLKELKQRMKKLDSIIEKFSSLLVKANIPNNSSAVPTKKTAAIRGQVLKKVIASDRSAFMQIVEKNLGIDSIAAEQRQLIKQLRDMLPSIKSKKHREAIAKEVEDLSKNLDRKLAKFAALVDKLSKEELVPRVLKAMATRIINMLSKKSIKFQVSRYLVPVMLDNNTIRFATYIRIKDVPSVTDPKKKKPFNIIIFTDVDKNDMKPGSTYVQISPDYVDPRDLGKPGSGAIVLKSSATKTALRHIHNYLLKNGYSLLKPIKGNEPPLDMKALPKWLRDDVSFQGRVIVVNYRVGSHPQLGDRHPGPLTGKVKPQVIFDGDNYLYEGDDARLVKKPGGWFFTPTRELIESIFSILQRAMRSRVYSVYYNPGIAAKMSKRPGKMNTKDYSAIIPLYYTVIQKK